METDAAADEAVWALARTFPQFSAHIRLTRGQVATVAFACAALLAGVCLVPDAFAVVAAMALAVGFMANLAFRCVLIWIGAGDAPPSLGLRRLSDTELPVYTILVPVYREANVLPGLIESLRTLDYPGIR